MSGSRFGPGGDSNRLNKAVMKSSLGILILVILLTLSLTYARPTEIKRQKRQSDQRIAELETLLALQKYDHRLREWGRGRKLAPPGYGLIDFDKIGRKKKSTRFSPGEEEEEGKVWSAAAWFLPMTSHQQQQFDTKSPPSILDSQVDQK